LGRKGGPKNRHDPEGKAPLRALSIGMRFVRQNNDPMSQTGTRRPRVFAVVPCLHSFVRKDLELLRKNFEVRVGYYRNPWSTPSILLGTLWADITFSRFADIHAFPAVLFSRIFGKKSIVVVGGYEVAKIPEIRYGLVLSPVKSHILRYVLKRADRVLTVDESLKSDAIRNVGVDGENITTVPNGFDSEKFSFKGEKENMVLTAYLCSTWQRVRLKGLDTFVRTAEHLPHLQFVTVGVHGPVLKDLRRISPSNVTFIPPVEENDLIPYYRRAKVYCQLSMREGLPNALCEAMLCECVPVGTDVQGIRTAMGDAGFYASYGDPLAVKEAIEKALATGSGKLARERIRRLFPLEQREKRLAEIIEGLTHE